MQLLRRLFVIITWARPVVGFGWVGSVRRMALSARTESAEGAAASTPGSTAAANSATTTTFALDVSDRPLITDAAFTAILSGIVDCSLLTSLDTSGCGQLTDAAVQTIVSTGCRLTAVNVSGCRNFTDEAIKAITASGTVRSLNVAYCGKLLTDESITAVARNCPALTSLTVADCKFLTDASLEALGNGCPALTTLDVSRCKQLTDESIQALVVGCPALTTLNLRNCALLTDAAIRAVATLPQLRALRIFGCRKVTAESIQALAVGCPTLRTLDTTKTFRQLFQTCRSKRGN